MCVYDCLWLCITKNDKVWLCMTLWLCLCTRKREREQFKKIIFLQTFSNYWNFHSFQQTSTLFTFVYLCLPLFKWHIYAQIFCLFYFFQLAGEVKHLVENSTNFPSFFNPSLTLLFLPSKVVFHQRSSSIKGVIYQRLCLSSKAVFHQRVSSINGHLLSKVAFYQRLSSIKGCLPSKVVFHQRLSFINKHLSSKVV